MLAAIIKRFLRVLLPLSVIYRVPVSGGKVVLTFDDGPNPEVTPRLLDVLDECNATATFFVIGEQADRHPDIIQDMKRRGHEVANHGYKHTHAKQVGAAREKANAMLGQEKLFDLGYQHMHYRPPYGEITAWGLLSLLWLDYRFVFWSWDSEDSNEDDPGAFAETLERLDVRAGDVLLFHDDYMHTVEQMPSFLKRLKDERGLECVSLESVL